MNKGLTKFENVFIGQQCKKNYYYICNMGINKCLNCNREIKESFCPNCGQKTTTHRFTFQHFIHDFLHGVFHLDKGFFYTLKELFTRPGHSTRDYIKGKRVNYFNAFTLTILLVTITHLIENYLKFDHTKLNLDKKQYDSLFKVLITLKEYEKVIQLFRIPFFAFASFLLFKKSKQNYIEHLILNMYVTSGIMVIGIFSTLLMGFNNNNVVQNVIENLASVVALIYLFCFFLSILLCF